MAWYGVLAPEVVGPFDASGVLALLGCRVLLFWLLYDFFMLFWPFCGFCPAVGSFDAYVIDIIVTLACCFGHFVFV